MLHTLNDLEGFAIQAIDGNIGKIKDFYFDDRRWVIRHLVVEIGSLLESHKVLLSPVHIKHLNREDKTILVDLSVDDIKTSPHIDTDRPVSQQYEIDYLSYYGYAFYWGTNSLWDSNSDPKALTATGENPKAAETFAAIDTVRRMHGDRHLRSCNEIVNYHIQASDGEIGHLQGMMIDEDTWAIRYFIANTSNWWLGHQVLIDPQEVQDISWGNAKIYVNMTQQQIQSAPMFDPEVPLNRQKELGVYLHYGRDGYWEEGVESKSSLI
jgi:uncharacterized protein YrrD